MSSPKRQLTWVVVMSAILAARRRGERGRPADRQDRPARDARRALRRGRPGRHAGRRAGREAARRHGGGQEDRDHQGVVGRQARRRRQRHAQAGRAGQGRHHGRARSPGSEGIAVKNYSKSQPNITFINGSSGAQATTLVDPSPNFFRFNTEGAQWMVGPRRVRVQGQGLQEDGADRRGLRLPVLAGAGLHDRVLQGGRARHAQGVGAARQQGLLVGHRQAAPGRRRAAGRAGRRRRGELPHAVRAGGRQQADGGRLDHRRPDRAQLQGQAARVAARHAVGRPHRRQLRRARSGRSSSPTTRRTSRTASRAPRCSRTSTTST